MDNHRYEKDAPMKIGDLIWLCAGIGMGAAVVLYDTEAQESIACQVYKVAARPVTSYILKPPACTPTTTVVYKACPQTTEKAEPVSEPIETKAEEKPRRHRRHWRRRHW